MRCFWALEVPRTLWGHVERVQRLLRRAGVAASWTRPEHLHLTVRFLGEQPEERLGELEAVGRRVAGRSRPFELESDGVGAFPDLGRPRVVWIGFRRSQELEELFGALEGELRLRGFDPEMRPFRPHLTVARLKESRSLRGLLTGLELEAVRFAVRELVLFRSELHPTGARYSALLRIPLGLQDHPG
nr:MAG: RNA 2',3'-cyclic phosphodiesterase [Bacteroidota bacterium]